MSAESEISRQYDFDAFNLKLLKVPKRFHKGPIPLKGREKLLVGC